MQVIVDNLLTEYQRLGSGTRTVVILHGWGDSSKGWQSFAKKLAPNYTLIVPDLPGFGGTAQPKTAWDLTDYAKFVAHFLHKLGVTETYAFIGHSNGGGIVIRGLGRNILTADKLVLLDSAGIRGVYKGRNKAFRLIAKTGKALTVPLPAVTRKKLQRKFYTSIGSDLLVAEHLQATFKKIVADDVRADAAKVNQPTLLIYGEKDAAAPVNYGQLFHELMPDSTLEVLPGAEHFVHLERETEVVKIVEGFLHDK